MGLWSPPPISGHVEDAQLARRVGVGRVNNFLTIASSMWGSASVRRGTSAMDSLPPCALWMIAVAVGFSLGLAFRKVWAISRFMHPTLWPRGSKGSPWFGPEQVRTE